MTGKLLLDLGYFSLRNFSFTHPVITEDGEPLITTPRFFDSPGTHTY